MKNEAIHAVSMGLPVEGVTRKVNSSLKLSFAYKFMKIGALHAKF